MAKAAAVIVARRRNKPQMINTKKGYGVYAVAFGFIYAMCIEGLRFNNVKQSILF